MGGSSYTYVEVTSISNSQRYFYRADKIRVRTGDVVIVPMQNGNDFAIIENILYCTDKNAPYPPEMLKFIIKVAGRRVRTMFADLNMRVVMDISVATRKTMFGEITIVVDQAQRNSLREKLASSNVIFFEYYPVSMAGQVVRENGKLLIPPQSKPESQQGKPAKWLVHSYLFNKEFECSYCHVYYNHHFPICPNCRKYMILDSGKAPVHKAQIEKTAYWAETEHLWGDKTYECSNCNTVYNNPSVYCPSCRCKMTKTKSDPVWVDEMAEYDEIFDEDEMFEDDMLEY